MTEQGRENEEKCMGLLATTGYIRAVYRDGQAFSLASFAAQTNRCDARGSQTNTPLLFKVETERDTEQGRVKK